MKGSLMNPVYIMSIGSVGMAEKKVLNRLTGIRSATFYNYPSTDMALSKDRERKDVDIDLVFVMRHAWNVNLSNWNVELFNFRRAVSARTLILLNIDRNIHPGVSAANNVALVNCKSCDDISSIVYLFKNAVERQDWTTKILWPKELIASQ